MIDVEVIETPSLGDRSYLASDGEVAVVIDPQRDVDRVIARAGRRGVRITHILETHVHNDYVSGGVELARLTGAVYAMAAADEVALAPVGLVDGQVLEVSPRLRVRVVATPGHTFHHLSYVLEGPHGPQGVFTGGSLLYGTTGRPDLAGDEHAEALARAQHASAHRLVAMLPGGAQIWPTHGFGSFCTTGAATTEASTVREQEQLNPVLRVARDQFVAGTLSGLGAYPAYYAHMGALNTAGPPNLDLRPPAVAAPGELAGRLGRGEWVVDLRSRTAFCAAHLAGTVSLGSDGPMATYLGWLLDWGTPVTLIGANAEQVGQAQRELARIGVDRVAAAAAGTPDQLAVDPSAQLARLPRATFTDLWAARAQRGQAAPGDPELPPAEVVLDVRLAGEWQGAHVEDAVHIALPELPHRLGEVPDGAVWVHCASGYRAAAAASLLARAGRTVVVIDDTFDTASAAGIPLIEAG